MVEIILEFFVYVILAKKRKRKREKKKTQFLSSLTACCKIILCFRELERTEIYENDVRKKNES